MWPSNLVKDLGSAVASDSATSGTSSSENENRIEINVDSMLHASNLPEIIDIAD